MHKGVIKYTSQQILDGIRKGDKDVLNYVYNRFFDSLKSFVLSNNGSKEDAFDLFQDAIMVVLEKIRKDDLKLTVKFSTYFYGVYKLIWLNVLRDRRNSILVKSDFENELRVFSIDEIKEIERLGEKEKIIRIYQTSFKMLSKECQKMIRFEKRGYSVEVIKKKFNYRSMSFTYKKRRKCIYKLKKIISNSLLA